MVYFILELPHLLRIILATPPSCAIPNCAVYNNNNFMVHAKVPEWLLISRQIPIFSSKKKEKKNLYCIIMTGARLKKGQFHFFSKNKLDIFNKMKKKIARFFPGRFRPDPRIFFIRFSSVVYWWKSIGISHFFWIVIHIHTIVNRRERFFSYFFFFAILIWLKFRSVREAIWIYNV